MDFVTRLPSIHNGPTIAPQAEPDKAREVYLRMNSHPEQRRKLLVWHDLLAKIAESRCIDQARNGWTGHVDPDGHGPNFTVRAWGYRLPSSYPGDDAANNIESTLHGGNGDVERAWNSWMGSEHHRVHILALDDFFKGQINVGIGYYFLDLSAYNHYFCILTCHPEEAAQ